MKKVTFLFLFTMVFLIAASSPFLISADHSNGEDDDDHSLDQSFEQSFEQSKDQPLGQSLGQSPKELPVVGSYQKLKSLMKEAQQTSDLMYRSYAVTGTVAESLSEESSVAVSKESADLATDNGADFSTTNIQVQGVDEADVIKTDGEYIYQVNHDRIIIAKAYPANEMNIVDTLRFDEKNIQLHEIYADDKHLVVIGSSYHGFQVEEQKNREQKKITQPHHRGHTVKAIVYNIQDKANITPIREVELEGSYVSSRKIGSSLYLIANRYLDVHYILNHNNEYVTPAYRDSNVSSEDKIVDYQDIHYFPDSIEPNYLLIGGLDLNNLEKEMDVSTYLGTGENIYASQDHLYVAVTQYDMENETNPESTYKRHHLSKSSAIYKFKLDQGNVQYVSQGKVPGKILNQFSMDQHNGFFRIATTTGEIWREDEHTSKNNLYILDENLQVTGKIEDIAPGEKIYSVRFMGDRGYMVTFKTVDPLFVIDLKDPTAPSILGKLKIPGYSDYLHPYDENHIIGFGKDTKEYTQGKGNPNVAYYQGMKIAIFDVSDVSDPKEKFVEIIGDRGTDSELLYNHKALLFSREKNLLSFPVRVMEIDEDQKKAADITQYGEFTFQGAYVYGIDLEQGFTLRKKITHISDEEYRKSGQRWYESNNNVERIIYIGDTLYTLSKGMIKAHELGSFEEINRIEIPQE
jgi:inhibitor of cysteine peptidase